MAKRILAERDPPKGKRGAGKARFLAHKDEIVLALEKGWNKRDVWQDLKDRGAFEFSYVQFTKYVARYIEGRTVEPKGAKVALEKSASRIGSEPEEQKGEKPEETKVTERESGQGPLKVQGVKIKDGVKHQPQAGSVKDSDLF